MKLRITWSNGDIEFRDVDPEFELYHRDLIKNKNFSFERMIETYSRTVINLKHARTLELWEYD